ncbi:hypothetical protein Purlil1_8558 [Purpureocillium lilacinum]|uniref:Uncharacterized protein n=1 Tax=Purpureocillium lilacinum TaxID=33203 RepID=A0ABR0BSL7_PURLI|nr:hypothetical protein Purlil1_8558 [Purpureocillium lilacinum]
MLAGCLASILAAWLAGCSSCPIAQFVTDAANKTPPSQSQIAIDIANRLSRTGAPRPLDCPALAALLRYPAPAAPEPSSILRPAPPARRSHVGRDDVCVGQATRAELKATTPTQPLRPVAPVGRQRNAQLSLARRLVVVRSSHWWALRWTVYGGGTGTTTPKKKDGQAQRGRDSPFQATAPTLAATTTTPQMDRGTQGNPGEPRRVAPRCRFFLSVPLLHSRRQQGDTDPFMTEAATALHPPSV